MEDSKKKKKKEEKNNRKIIKDSAAHYKCNIYLFDLAGSTIFEHSFEREREKESEKKIGNKPIAHLE